jgi:hypothetical protein
MHRAALEPVSPSGVAVGAFHDSDALYDSVARTGASVLDAPIGFVTLGGGEVVRIAGLDWWTRGWLEARPGARQAVADLVQNSAGPVDHRNLQLNLLDGVRTFTAYPLRLDDGSVIGHVGAMDTIPRDWTPRQREGLESLSRVSMAQLQARMEAAQDRTIRHIGRHLADGLAALDSTLTPLLDHAAAQDDAVLQRRAAAARARLDDVRLRQDHLEQSVVSARPVARPFDLGEAVRLAILEVERSTRCEPILALTEPLGLPVVAQPAGTLAAITDVLRLAVREHGSPAVRVHVRRHEVASHAIDGTLAAELEVSVAGGLEPGDIARIGATFARARGVGGGEARMCMEGDEVRLSAPGLDVVTSMSWTTVKARWPLDLG